MSGMDTILSFACPTLAPQIRVVKNDRGESRFIASDICNALSIKNVSDACAKLPTEDKGIVRGDTRGGEQDMLVVTEAGMYWLIVRSDKPAARPLLMWITHEVLPSIRKTGQYIMPGQRKPTRWGWQPIRDVVRSQGYSAKDFAASANALDLPDVTTFTEGNYAAWTYGGCLPTEALITRAEALLDVSRDQLFTAEVLESYHTRGPGRRHNRTGMKPRILV